MRLTLDLPGLTSFLSPTTESDMDVMIELRASEGGEDAKNLVELLTDTYLRASVRGGL